MKALKSSNARDQNAQQGYRVISGPRQQESVFVYTANRMAWQPRERTLETNHRKYSERAGTATAQYARRPESLVMQLTNVTSKKVSWELALL